MKTLVTKKYRYKYIFTTLLVLQSISCQYTEKYTKEFVYECLNDFNSIENAVMKIDVSTTKSLSYRDFIDHFVDSVYFLQLSSKELIGEVTTLRIFEDRIFILDQFVAKKVFIFNMKGDLIRVIENQGGGPNEYLRLGGININEVFKELIIADEGYPKFLHYSLDGNFIRETQSIPNIFYYPGKNDYFYNCVGYKQLKSGTDQYHTLLLCKDTMVANAGFPFYPIQQDAVTSNPFNKNVSGELLYIPFLCDTVYCLLDNHFYQAKYVINQTKSLWNRKDEFLSNTEQSDLILNNDYTSLGSYFYENEDFCCFFISMASKGRVLSRPYYYNKKTKMTFCYDFEKSFNTADPFKKGLYMIKNPQCVYKDYFVASFNPTPVVNESMVLNRDYLKVMKAANDNTNPALVFYKFNGGYE